MSSNDTSSQISKWIGIAIIGLLLLIGIGIVATTFTNYGSNSGHTPGFGFVPIHFGFFGVLFFIIIIILISRWLFWSNRYGYTSRYYYGHSSKDSAIKILNDRYAKGEITKDDYTHMKQDIQDGDP
ncbi:MAG: SHOCT domain-containing protein [Candidatus Nitrosocosmicus sp.]